MFLDGVSLKYYKRNIVKTGSIWSKWPTVYTAVLAKPLQNQNLSFVLYFFFNDNAISAVSITKGKLEISKGTINFLRIIGWLLEKNDWFHMMHFGDRYSGIIMRDKCGQLCTKTCLKSKKLHETCYVIFSYNWSSGHSSIQKRMKEAISTKSGIHAV